MAWLPVAGLAFFILFRLVRRRRKVYMALPSQPFSTIRVQVSKKHTAKTRAALEAASSTLC
jgi:hypothetical protein